jgi:HSP20 family protein
VTVDDGTLTLSGERKFEKETKEENFHRVERSFGSFSRSFALPETVDADNVSASYKKGVLEVTLPKTESKEKKVKVVAVN